MTSPLIAPGQETVYLTKYATTTGKIEVLSGVVRRDGDREFLWDGWSHYYIGRDVFRTQEEAIKAAGAQRAKKIESLKKQIAKLEKIEDKVVLK